MESDDLNNIKRISLTHHSKYIYGTYLFYEFYPSFAVEIQPAAKPYSTPNIEKIIWNGN
jgi:hypothetical protein